MASETSGQSNNETQSLNNPTEMKSYAKAATRPAPPTSTITRNQAIVLDSIEGCTNDDYVDGLETVDEPISTPTSKQHERNQLNTHIEPTLANENITENRKRPSSLSTSSDTMLQEAGEHSQQMNTDADDSTDTANFREPSPRKVIKKKKTDNRSNSESQSQNSDSQIAPINLEGLLSPAKEIIDNSLDRYPLNFTCLRRFMERSYGHQNVLELAGEYTEDIEGLTQMLDEVHAVVIDKTFKGRLTRVKNKLRKKRDTSESEHTQKGE
ncbi:hypothetical protein QAD02_001252 [Eretmocerus hayati]|uniref:Uncharacterized protein n=1 Tax=Eretmocerus hayati TaxID=131215 RepID=A0ACC2NGR4_9HYME|nr:hypothetical protein QAD02_001252 [Eretmocerus hayati]